MTVADKAMDPDTAAVVTQLSIRNRRGLHARASAKFVSTVGQYNAEVWVAKDGVEVNGKSIMGLMMLAAAPGDEIQVRASGEEARQAVEALARLVEDKFGED